MLKWQFSYFQKNIVNIKMLIALLAVAMWSILYTDGYLKLANMLDCSVNVLEPSIYLLSNSSTSAFLFALCFVFSFCDVPFEDGALPYCVYRMGYKRWFIALITFTVIFCVLFLSVPIFVSCLLCVSDGFFSLNIWSNVARLTANGGAPQLAFLPIFSRVLMFYSPGEAIGLSFILTFLHYLLIAGTLLCFNCVAKKIWSVCFVIGTEITGFILLPNFPKIARCFPFANTALTELTHKNISEELSCAPYASENCLRIGFFIILLMIMDLFLIKRYKFELGEEK